jgi:calcium binding protein 39
VLKNEAAAAIVLFDDGEELGSSTKGVTAIERDRLQSGNGVFWRFFDWIDKSSFEVAADAFTTFRVRLLSIKTCQGSHIRKCNANKFIGALD